LANAGLVFSVPLKVAGLTDTWLRAVGAELANDPIGDIQASGAEGLRREDCVAFLAMSLMRGRNFATIIRKPSRNEPTQVARLPAEDGRLLVLVVSTA
jgi:hypothetical protein